MIAAIIADLNGDTKSQQTYLGEYFESQEQRIRKARCFTALTSRTYIAARFRYQLKR